MFHLFVLHNVLVVSWVWLHVVRQVNSFAADFEGWHFVHGCVCLNLVNVGLTSSESTLCIRIWIRLLK